MTQSLDLLTFARTIAQQNTVTKFEFLGPDGSHPSHLVPSLKAQAKVGWETTFSSTVLSKFSRLNLASSATFLQTVPDNFEMFADLNREKLTRELMPLENYKKVLLTSMRSMLRNVQALNMRSGRSNQATGICEWTYQRF